MHITATQVPRYGGLVLRSVEEVSKALGFMAGKRQYTDGQWPITRCLLALRWHYLRHPSQPTFTYVFGPDDNPLVSAAIEVVRVRRGRERYYLFSVTQQGGSLRSTESLAATMRIPRAIVDIAVAVDVMPDAAEFAIDCEQLLRSMHEPDGLPLGRCFASYVLLDNDYRQGDTRYAMDLLADPGLCVTLALLPGTVCRANNGRLLLEQSDAVLSGPALRGTDNEPVKPRLVFRTAPRDGTAAVLPSEREAVQAQAERFFAPLTPC